MQKNKLKQYDLDLYSDTLDNGLVINIVPKSNVNNIYVTFSTKYGSIHDEFIPIDGDKFIKVPLGIAHFLEHKMFEQEDGIDPFEKFCANGADSNANTSNYKTTYLFSSTNNLEKNINLLLDFVQSPYFTDDNVEKEKGIIAQELKMLHDNPYWRLYESDINNVFVEHPIKYPVGGTLESIYEITKEDLYTCYNTFYHPSNMFLTITGNVNPEEVLEIVKNNQMQKEFKAFKPILIKDYNEPDSIFKEYEEIQMDVNISKVSLAYKISKDKYDINKLRKYLNIYFSLLTGSTSILTEKLREKEYISTNLNYEVVNTDSHLAYLISFESNQYEYVLEEIRKVIGYEKITEEELVRKKKTIKSSYIYNSDNIFGINHAINKDIINYNEVRIDILDEIENMNLDELNDILDNISFENTSVVVLKNN